MHDFECSLQAQEICQYGQICQSSQTRPEQGLFSASWRARDGGLARQAPAKDSFAPRQVPAKANFVKKLLICAD